MIFMIQDNEKYLDFNVKQIKPQKKRKQKEIALDNFMKECL